MFAKDALIKPAIAGGLSALALRQQFGPGPLTLSGEIPLVGGQSYDTAVVGAVLGAVGAWASEVVKTNFFGGLSRIRTFHNFNSLVSGVLGQVAVHLALPHFLTSEGISEREFTTLIMTSIGVEVASEYIYDQFFAGY